jgi:hypothetical protein
MSPPKRVSVVLCAQYLGRRIAKRPMIALRPSNYPVLEGFQLAITQCSEMFV